MMWLVGPASNVQKTPFAKGVLSRPFKKSFFISRYFEIVVYFTTSSCWIWSPVVKIWRVICLLADIYWKGQHIRLPDRTLPWAGASWKWKCMRKQSRWDPLPSLLGGLVSTFCKFSPTFSLLVTKHQKYCLQVQLGVKMCPLLGDSMVAVCRDMGSCVGTSINPNTY